MITNAAPRLRSWLRTTPSSALVSTTLVPVTCPFR